MNSELDTSCLLVQFQLNLGALISRFLIETPLLALSRLHFLPTPDKTPSQPSAYLMLRWSDQTSLQTRWRITQNEKVGCKAD